MNKCAALRFSAIEIAVEELAIVGAEIVVGFVQKPS